MPGSKKVKILIADSQQRVRNALKERLEFEGYSVDTVERIEDGVEPHRNDPYDILLIDGDMMEVHLASEYRGIFNDLSSIVLSASPTIETAVFAIKHGAFDFVPKPVDMNQLLSAVRNVVVLHQDDRASLQPGMRLADKRIADKKSAKYASSYLEDNGTFELNRNCNCPEKSSSVESIIGNSLPINHVRSLIDKVGPSEARVLITGPNGTGKELVARWLHEKSPRCRGPFVEVNCAAIPSELIESELFGHEKGAFTSAIKQRKGKFEQANGGTLFLDEIGDMSLSAQAKVLRALQEHKISRVGSDHDMTVDVRVVSATNKNLRKEIDAGNFREDLFHRLSVIIINVPPLNARLDDIPLLVSYFVKKICAEYGISTKAVDANAVLELQSLDWTGNIRELRNVIERLIILSGDHITVDDVKTYAPSFD